MIREAVGAELDEKAKEPEKHMQVTSRGKKCPCVAGGIGYTDVCRCFNCGNIVQARADLGKTPN